MGLIRRPQPPQLRGGSASYAATWRTFSPVVYRYMDSSYVDAFFNDGSLRLTSFAKCRQHADEQRLDDEEGSLRLLTTDGDTGRMTLREIRLTSNAWILCTTLWHNAGLMRDFGCNSFIRIHDPAEFGVRVSKHIPDFQWGGEGPCMYQHLRLIETALPEPEERDSKTPVEAQAGEWQRLIQRYALFLKHKSYSHQAEYRLVWLSDAADGQDYLDIEVPEAIELCSREGTFEHEGFGEEPATR